MDGNEWNEFTTPEQNVFSEPDEFVRSYMNESAQKIQERVNRNAEQMKDETEDSEESGDREEVPDAEEEKESSNEIEHDSLRELIVEAAEQAHASRSTSRVCRVGSQVNRAEQGDSSEWLCLSTARVSRCSAVQSACTSGQRVPLRKVDAMHICVPKDSKTLRTVSRRLALDSLLRDIHTSARSESVDLDELVRALEQSPRSYRTLISVDEC